jgi:hypothetical protein
MTPVEIFAGVESFIIRIPYRQILSDSRRSHGRSSDSQTSLFVRLRGGVVKRVGERSAFRRSATVLGPLR